MKKPAYLLALTFVATCLLLIQANANNVQISNMSYLTGSDEIQFDISWENSWRNTSTTGSTNNYDGVWVFVKYRNSCAKDSVWPSATDYKHAWLSTTPSAHTIPGTAALTVGTTTIGGTPRGMGVFLYRNSDGSGTFSLNGVKLRWDKSAQGASGTDWDIQVFALEMVYIPQGAYYVGDGAASFRFHDGSSTNTPFLMNVENSTITLGSGAGNLNSSSYPMSGTLPSGFPKGFDAFWVMKYEVTQKNYCDYLNTLSRANQNTAAPNVDLTVGNTALTAAQRGAFLTFSTQRATYRNGIRVDGTTGNTNITIDPSKPVTFVCDLNENNAGNSVDDGQGVACNFLNATFLFRYLDWAALRPMNELEFEKIARGPSISPPYIQIPNESVWGTTLNISTNVTQSGGGLLNTGQLNEAPSTTGNGLVIGNTTSPGGPRRVGSTYTGSTNRITAGSSFYGAADLAGNVDEVVIALSPYNTQPAYTRSDYGDGNPFSTPFSSLNWPTDWRNNQPGVTSKGGGWNGSSTTDYIISYRNIGTSSGTFRSRALNGSSFSSSSNPENYPTVITSNVAVVYSLGGRGVR